MTLMQQFCDQRKDTLHGQKYVAFVSLNPYEETAVSSAQFDSKSTSDKLR